MRNITVLCVGKLKEGYLREACAEYAKRLGGFCRLSVVEVEEERAPDNPSPAQIEGILRAEGKRLLARVPQGAALIALCIEGKEMDSPCFARLFDRLAIGGVNGTALVIGGSFGLSEEVKAAAKYRLSLSPMTFPHQLTRVLLLEQIYRAMQILSGGKYHK